MSTKTTFVHSPALGRAIEAAALADGRTISCMIRRILEKDLGVTPDSEQSTFPKTRKLALK